MSTKLYVSHPAINNGNEKQMLSFQGLSRKDKISFSRKDGQIFFRKKLSTRFCLTNGRNNIQDYELIRAVMNLPSKCEPFYFRLTKLCQANSSIGLYDEVDIYVGQVAITEMSFNDCQCEVTFKLRPNDCYECIFKGWDLDQNIYNLAVVETIKNQGTRVTKKVSTFLPIVGAWNVNYEPPLDPTNPNIQLVAATNDMLEFLQPCTPLVSIPAADNEWVDPLEIFEDFWEVGDTVPNYPNQCPGLWWHFHSFSYPTGITGSLGYRIVTTWHREAKQSPVSPGSEWQQLPGLDVWVRCPLTSAEIYDQKYGRRLDEVLTHLIDKLDCGLSIRSKFFDINPNNDFPNNVLNNSAYQYAIQNLQHLTVHTAIDVKRSSDDEADAAGSRHYKMKLKDLLSDLQMLFDVYWDCVEYYDEDDTLVRLLRIEHISFYQDPERCLLDFSDDPKYSCNKFKYDREKIPSKEDFQYRNNVDASVPFLTTPITYTDVCADPNTNTDNTLEIFDTDIGAIADNEDFDEEGFVLVANKPQQEEQNYQIINSNYPLAWPELLVNLHTYHRPLLNGRLNGQDITFETVKPQRTIERIDASLCCKDYFDTDPSCRIRIGLRPQDPVVIGEVDKADWNIFEEHITYSIKA